MLKKATRGLEIAGLALVLAACGVTGPDAVPAANVTGLDAPAAASGGKLRPAEEKPIYCGVLQLAKVASEKGTATVQAYWSYPSKTFRSMCPVPTFSIEPVAKMFVPRYNPNQVTFAGKPGQYLVTASVDDPNYKPVSLVVDLE
ncbi:MAG TPA: hypothetical protein VF310_14150 [Vicinamibacteria bacterium]